MNAAPTGPSFVPDTHAPRYQQVASTLVREIGEGRYPVGSLLPPEPQLCQRFGVSRHTVREAVRHLCELGLVSRHQGVGTRVRALRTDKQYVASLSSLGDLMAYARDTRLEVMGARTLQADAELARQLRCEMGEPWVELDTCRRTLDSGEPIVHMRVFVRPEAQALLRELEQGQAWVFGLVEKYGGERILEAQQVVSSVAVPADSARILGVEPKSPGLLVRRFYIGRNDRLLSVSINVHPVGRFELTTRWHLDEGSAAA